NPPTSNLRINKPISRFLGAGVVWPSMLHGSTFLVIDSRHTLKRCHFILLRVRINGFQSINYVWRRYAKR
ncbi:MAG: hypothetical protein MRY59_13420, partial [Aquisalinus sp.]|nr:hypothetical protein [Aquisalinus sp.]